MQQLNIMGVLSSIVVVYANIFSNFTPDSILAQIQLLVIIKTVYFLLSSFLPIEGLVNTIFGPFTYMHQIFHAHTAKKLNHKYRDDLGRSKNPVRMSVSLGDSSIRSREYSNLSYMLNNTSELTIRDVMYFANASTVPAFVMLLVIVSMGPLMQQFIFAIIHLYIVCGITLCLMPSKADSKLITNFIVIRTELSAWYVVNVFITFTLSAALYAVKYTYLGYYPAFWFIEPILMGIWSVICYLTIFSLIVVLTEERKVFGTREGYKDKAEGFMMTDEEKLLLVELERSTRRKKDFSAEVNDFTMLSELEPN